MDRREISVNRAIRIGRVPYSFFKILKIFFKFSNYFEPLKKLKIFLIKIAQSEDRTSDLLVGSPVLKPLSH